MQVGLIIEALLCGSLSIFPHARQLRTIAQPVHNPFGIRFGLLDDSLLLRIQYGSLLPFALFGLPRIISSNDLMFLPIGVRQVAECLLGWSQ
jgi:hypothetical protein